MNESDGTVQQTTEVKAATITNTNYTPQQRLTTQHLQHQRVAKTRTITEL